MPIKLTLYQYGYVTCPPEWAVKEKSAAFHRLYYITGGEGSIEYSGDTICLKENMIYLFPINQPYRALHNTEDPLQCLYFHITTIPPVLNDLKVLDISSILKNYLEVLINLVGEKQVSGINNSHTGDSSSQKQPALITHLLEGLLYLIDREQALEIVRDKRLQKVLAYIHNNYCQDLKVRELARYVNLDYQYFVRYFKNSVGITPYQYLTNLRMDRAAFLLLDKIPVYQVAEKVGYHNSKAFSRAFKNNKGLSPSSFQKRQFVQP